ncbi:GLPGLI family protein [Labilibaculum sp.]|uniref:GLPGLI family protein n=1 Tax=Labilibaculum sp. TaxID=2060723 RepID=UPI003567319A
MRKFLFVVSAFLLGLPAILSAQEFQGKAVYQSKTTIEMDFGGRDIPEDRKKMMLERMKKAGEKTFVLDFNKKESIYKEEEKLEQPGNDDRRRGPGFGMMSDDGADYYKNVQDGNYAVVKDLFGKIFLVKDKLPNFEWKMEGETKQIGKYIAHKATSVRMVKRPNMSAVFRRDRDSESEEKEFIEKEVRVTAWYTFDVPVNQGPGSYWGLPGLILEVSDDRTSILCSQIIINPKERSVIKEPTKGKEVSQAEYDDISKKKLKEMKENGGFGRRGGGGPH